MPDEMPIASAPDTMMCLIALNRLTALAALLADRRAQLRRPMTTACVALVVCVVSGHWPGCSYQDNPQYAFISDSAQGATTAYGVKSVSVLAFKSI
jgi:hypothetical protein